MTTISTQQSVLKSFRTQKQSPLDCRGTISNDNYRLLMESAVLYAADEKGLYDHYHALLQSPSQTTIEKLESHYKDLTGE